MAKRTDEELPFDNPPTQPPADEPKKPVNMANEVKAQMGSQMVKKEDGVLQTKIQKITDLMNKNKGSFENALPRIGLTVERFLRIAITTISKNPKLKECTESSLMGSMLQAAQLGFSCDGLLGQAFLIPYRDNKTNTNICNLQIGYKGHIALAWRSNQLESINGNVVREGDEFDYSYGTDEFLKHRPKNPTGEILGAYVTFKTKNGGKCFKYISKGEIELRHRSKSKSPNSPGWVDNYESMCIKSALVEIKPWLPQSTEQAKAFEIDRQVERGEQNLDINILQDGEFDISPAEVNENG